MSRRRFIARNAHGEQGWAVSLKLARAIARAMRPPGLVYLEGEPIPMTTPIGE